MQLVKVGEDDLKRYRGFRSLALELTRALCTFLKYQYRFNLGFWEFAIQRSFTYWRISRLRCRRRLSSRNSYRAQRQ
jgi:hypothetical protein